MLAGPMIAKTLLIFAAVAPPTASSESSLPPAATQQRPKASWVSLPTQRETRAAVQLAETSRPPDLSQWLRPRLGLAAEWEPETEGVEIGSYDADLTVPTYPVYGLPPPLLTTGFSYTDLRAPAELDLPTSLYDFAFGATWMRPVNARWTLRFMASAALASDLDNMSSDAWQFRGGLFALYGCRPNLQLLVGAYATGREDIPVLPGLGLIWTPTPYWHLNLMMPRPRIAYMIADHGARQHWVFLGGGLNGGTWAFESNGVDDRLTYREWRVGLGWESAPPKSFPPMPGSGLKFETEVGYVFGREFEFDSRTPTVGLNDALLLRVGLNF